MNTPGARNKILMIMFAVCVLLNVGSVRQVFAADNISEAAAVSKSATNHDDLWIEGYADPFNILPQTALNVATWPDYRTGFEKPIFKIGPLHGQDGWQNPTNSASISGHKPIKGDQSIKVDVSGPLNDFGSFRFTRVGHLFFCDAPVVDVSVDARLDGPSTDTGAGPDDDLVSANLDALGLSNQNLPSFLGSLLLSSSGEVWICGSRPEDYYAVGVGICLKKYHRLGMRIDFIAQATYFFVDGEWVTTLPFDESITTDIFAIGALKNINPNQYTAYFDNYSIKAFAGIPFDIKPGICPNPLNLKSHGVLSAAILGTIDFDVSKIDPSTIRLVVSDGKEGIRPVRWTMADVATPYTEIKDDAHSCNKLGSDGYMDLTLKYDTQAIASKLGPVKDRDVKLFKVIGKLKEEFGSTPITGEDFVLILHDN